MTINSLYMLYPSDGGCSWHRVMQPARFVAPSFEFLGKKVTLGNDFPTTGYDAVWFHGLPTDLAAVYGMRLKHGDAKLIWGLDDDWKSIEAHNPAKTEDYDNRMAMFDVFEKLADLIVVSTPALAATFPGNDRVVVAPNLLDLSLFPDFPFTTEGGHRYYDFADEKQIRIVWSGGPTHSRDVEPLVEPLSRILETFGRNRVMVVFQGQFPPSELARKYLNRGVIHQPMVTFPAYQGVVNSIKPHVYLAPQEKSPFNLSKSNLRVMEGWGLMAVPVATPWGEYGCIHSGRDGRYADSTEEWVSALNRLVTDPAYRCQLAATGRQRVEDEYDWNSRKCREPWVEAFARVFEVEVPNV